MASRGRRSLVRRPARVRRADLPPGRRGARASSSRVELGRRLAAVDLTPTPSGCSRCSRTCSPTPSSSPRRGGVDLAGRAGRERLERRPPESSAGPSQVIAFAVSDTGHRHPRGQAARSSSSRSSRPTRAPAASTAAPAWACRSAGRSPAARRRDPRGQHRRRGQHLHALPAPDVISTR